MDNNINEVFVEFNEKTKEWEVYDSERNLLAKNSDMFKARIAALGGRSHLA